MRGCVVGRVLKDGTQRYGVKWSTPAGRQCWKTIGTKRQAQRALVQICGELESQGAAYQYRDTRFSDYMERHLTICEESGLKASTIATYRTTSRRLVTHFGHAKMRSCMTVAEVQSFVSARIRVTDTAKTVNKALDLLSSVCERAVNESILPFNPVRRVDRPRTVTRDQRESLTVDQVADVLRWTAPQFRPALTVAALTALRPSELCGLIYETDIDWSRNELVVQRTAWRGSLYPLPKQNRVRRVPFGATVRRILELQRDAAAASRQGTVFSGPRGGIMEASRLNNAFKVACRRAGVVLPAGQDGQYSLRHAACSNWLHAGFDPATISSIAGNSVRTLTTTYLHSNRERVHDAARVLDIAVSDARTQGAQETIETPA